MHDVSNAINILDPSKTIDTKICNEGSNDWNDVSNTGDNKGSLGNACASKNNLNGSGAKPTGLNLIMSEANQPSGSTKFPDETKLEWIPKTSANISKDISKLAREQKGVVSSAFAKAHEGAEIVEIRSISTTSEH